MRGRFKYICDDCDSEIFLTPKQRTSKFIPRCKYCGSTYLTESKYSIARIMIASSHTAKERQYEKLAKKQNIK